MTRSYETQQQCPVARSLDILGDRWTLLLIRDLLRGTSRFSDLLQSLDGVSPNLLSTRLKALERDDIIERSFYSEHPPRAEYRLTAKGEALRPAIQAIYEWGERYLPVQTNPS